MNLRRASFRGAHAHARVAFGALAKGIFAADRVGSAKKFASAMPVCLHTDESMGAGNALGIS